MKYSVYVLKCEHEKFYVGFSTRELDKYFEIIKDGKGPKFSRIHKPLNIISIGTFESIEEAKKENVKVYEILANVLGNENVEMDERRYHEVKGCFPLNSQESTRIDISNNQKCVESSDISMNKSPSENILRGEYIAYCLLCIKKARYIGMTKNLTNTLKLHKEGKILFTKWYTPIKIERKKYCKTEFEAKLKQTDFLDDIRLKYGPVIRIYTEFIDSKPDKRIVWEHIIRPKYEELFENTPSGPNINYWVYILECEDSKYYVGFTSNLRERFERHASGPGGSNYTFKYKPVYVLHIEGHYDELSAKNAERTWTLDLKKIKGKYNVSGYLEDTGNNELPFFDNEILDTWEIKNPKAWEL
ncbi:GIY-YIG catalytic domain protein [uncultured archaeon]|nr:GIY-YIG catalytic domain protein [uncultured archaeon]